MVFCSRQVGALGLLNITAAAVMLTRLSLHRIADCYCTIVPCDPERLSCSLPFGLICMGHVVDVSLDCAKLSLQPGTSSAAPLVSRTFLRSCSDGTAGQRDP